LEEISPEKSSEDKSLDFSELHLVLDELRTEDLSE